METYIDYLDKQVDRAIYVRGAQGENLLAMTDAESWIRAMETTRRKDYAQHTAEYDRNAERAIALYRKRKAAGISPLRAFDCSGLTMCYAQNMRELVSDDYNAAGIYSLLCSKKIAGAPTIRGQLVFKSSNGTPEKISHMGTYAGNGQVIESKGRDDGVIRRVYRETDWNFTGEWPALMACCVDPQPIGAEMNGDIMIAIQRAINAAGYVDGDNHPLKEDGKFGPKTAAALEQLVRYNMPDLALVITRSGPIWAYAEEI